MAETNRPQVDPSLIQDASPELHLVQEAFGLLTRDPDESAVMIGDVRLPIVKTEAIDLAGENDTLISLRLRSVPVLIIDNGQEEVTHMDAANYFVMDLEHRTVPDDDTVADEVFYHAEQQGWSRYLRIIINTVHNTDVTIVDGEKHTPLSPQEISFASFLLAAMREEDIDAEYEESLRHYAQELAKGVSKTLMGKYIIFDSTDYLQTSDCEDKCGTSNQACAHNPHTLS